MGRPITGRAPVLANLTEADLTETGPIHVASRPSAQSVPVQPGPVQPGQVSVLLPRVVPLRVEPVAGEALDSWLHAYARRLDVPVISVVKALGLGPRSPRRDASLLPHHLDLTVGLSTGQARRAGHAAGVSAAVLHAMTLASYAPAVVHLRRDRTAITTTTPWMRRRGSRYCPDCLRRNGGRWLLRWQLSWVFACTHHQALLRDLCPACGLVPRSGNPAVGLLPDPSGCAATPATPDGVIPRQTGPSGQGRRGPRMCGTDLSSVPPLRLPPDDGRLATQHRLDAYLDLAHGGWRVASQDEPRDKSLGESVGEGVAVLTPSIWTDLHALAWWLAITAMPEDFSAFDEATATAWRRVTLRPWARHQYLVTADARITAALLTWALPIAEPAHPALPRTSAPGAQTAPSKEQLRELLQELSGRRRRAHEAVCHAGDRQGDRKSWVQGFKPAGMLASDWRDLSAPVKGLLLRAADTDLPKVDRLRAWTPTPAARPPDFHGKNCARRARWIPQILWPEWLVRLMPATGLGHDTHRAALAAALMLPGAPTTVSAADAARGTHPHLRRTTVTGMLRLYLEDGRLKEGNLEDGELRGGNSSVFAAICDLAAGLDRLNNPNDDPDRLSNPDGDAHGAPGADVRGDRLTEHDPVINYHRRRRLITGGGLLTKHQWEEFCEAAGCHPGKGRRLIDARRYLFTTLTGADLTDPQHRLAVTGTNDRNLHVMFLEQMPTPLRRLLLQHAVEHLTTLGLDEPLTWSPPAEWVTSVALDALPGRDPDDIDMAALADLTARHQPVGAIASTLGVSIEHVRLALERLVRPSPGHDVWTVRLRADRQLTRAFFEREYLTAGKTLRELEAQTGFTRKMIGDYAKAAGITMRTSRPPTPIDPDWLREQYVIRQRSFPEIADEVGVSCMVVIRAAGRYGIDSRPQGVASRNELLTRLPDWAPADLRRAVEGNLHAWARLERFAEAMTYPSLTQAGIGMAISVRTLVTQFHRLERDIGAPLYHRTPPGRPAGTGAQQRPTARGAALIHALAQPEIKALRHPQARSAARGTAGYRTLTEAELVHTIQARNLPSYVAPAVQRALLNPQGHLRRGGWRRLQRFTSVMAYPTLTEAAAALDIEQAILSEQLALLEQHAGGVLVHRATSRQPQRPTRQGAALLRALAEPQTAALLAARTRHSRSRPKPDAAQRARPVVPAPPSLDPPLPDCPIDLRRAVQDRRAGWTRLERFAIAMTYPTQREAADAIGIDRTTLIEQLHRVENDVGARLFHRATIHGDIQRPTRRGAALLRALAQPDLQPFRARRARLAPAPALPPRPTEKTTTR